MFDASQFNGVARKRALPAGAGELQLLFMSRLVPGKGAKETVDAFCIVAESVPGLHLVCAGNGPDSEQLQHRVKERGLANRVSFPGFVRGPDKAQLLLDSDLFIFPSRLAEGCPVALLEAMGAGLPVVTADTGGIGDVFRDGVNGVLLGALPDAQAIADAIAGMIGDVATLRRIGRHNAAEAHARFEAGSWCHALEADYMSLVSRAKTSSSESRSGY
jgi:glycosyltransferase involved in cell wall biosynthesis